MAAPSAIDLIAPFDPTAYATITGAQLLQLVSGAIPYSDKGFTVATDDVAGVPEVPNAAVTTKWQNFLWIRRTATSVNAYLWSPAVASDPTYLKWVSVQVAAIGVGSITGAMIADFTISDAKIISLDISKISGYVAGGPPTGAAGGDLTGTYPNPSVANAAITGTKIAGTTITHANLAAQAVEVGTDVKPSAVGLSLIRTNAGATAMEHFIPQWVTLLANPASAADVGKAVVVKSPYTDGFELAASAFVKKVAKVTTTSVSTAAVIPYDGSIPLIAEGADVPGLTLSYTPINANSIVKVTVTAQVANDTATAGAVLALFNNATCVAAAGYIASTANAFSTVTLDYVFAPGSTAAIPFTVRLGATAGNAFMLRNTGLDPLFGAASKAFIVIEEFLGTLT